MLNFRAATPNDLEPLLDLIEVGFSHETEQANLEVGREHRILFEYLYSLPDWSPERVFLAEKKGQLVAAVGFFPQVLNFDGLMVPVWAISPVVCHPQYRGNGYAGACLTQALEYINQSGVSAVFLWGLPDYYPRFGFVPILPRYYTKLSLRNISSTHQVEHSQGRLRTVKSQDLAAINTIYNNKKSWLQPQRGWEWWQNRFTEMGIELAKIKEVPFPEKDKFLVWENNSGEIGAYLYFDQDFGKRQLIITESVSNDVATADSMLQEFIKTNLNFLQIIKIRGTPAEYLNMAAYRRGGIHINYAPRQGMIKILNWAELFKQLTPLWHRRLAGIGFNEIDYDRKEQILDIKLAKETITLIIKGNEGLITKLIFGLYDEWDLKNLKHKVSDLKMIFPEKYPFIWDANYLY